MSDKSNNSISYKSYPSSCVTSVVTVQQVMGPGALCTSEGAIGDKVITWKTNGVRSMGLEEVVDGSSVGLVKGQFAEPLTETLTLPVTRSLAKVC